MGRDRRLLRHKNGLPKQGYEDRSKTEAEAFRDYVSTMMDFQDMLKERWASDSLPADWQYLDSSAPICPAKTKVTLRLETDMLRWFRKLGPGYQKRINQVLRIYWKALLAGKIKAHYDEPEVGPIFNAAQISAEDSGP